MNQGAIGSCVACATGYTLKTYMEGVDHGWDISQPSHQFCPSYLYNQIDGGGDNGAEMPDAFNVMYWRGITSLSVQAYDGSGTAASTTTWPTQAQCASAQNFRTGLTGASAYGTISTTALSSVKAQLSAGVALTLAFQVDGAWDNLGPGTNYVWYPNFSYDRGWHDIVIIGYDDTMTDGAGHVGALKVQNSWGTGWGNDGRCWIAYDALSAFSPVYWQATDTVFYYCTDLPASYSSTIQAQVQVNHPKRGRISITAGVGSISSPVWKFTYYQPLLINMLDGFWDDTHPNVYTTLDLSGAAAYWPPTPSQPWWIQANHGLADGVTGTVIQFSVTQGATTYSDGNLPIAIPDYGSAYAVIPPGPDILLVAGFPSPATTGTPGSFTVTAQKPGGLTDSGYTGTVYFTSSDAAAALPADYTFVSGDTGVHTFTATLNTVGTQTITATDTVTTAITGTQPGITVKPPPPPVITSPT